MPEKTDIQSRLLRKLESRIRNGWDRDPLFIDPSIEPGMTPSQTAALTRASAQASTSGIPHFIAILPHLPSSDASREGWARFTADLAYSMFEDAEAKQILVIFSTAENSASSFAYIVDGNGATIPRGSNHLQGSKTNHFLPVELAVPYKLSLLIATVKGTEAPPVPDFEPNSSSEDYIDATGLEYGDPDGFVFKATATAAFGLGAWLLLRRNKYSWRGSLTQSPELVRSRKLPQAVDSALRSLPDPATLDEAGWALHDRGRRIQEAISDIVRKHPDWASDIDFSHRYAIFVLTVTDRWVRTSLRQNALSPKKTQHEDAPRFCFFFPTHTGKIKPFVWKQSKTVLTINLCAACRADLNAEHEPECLMVPKSPNGKRIRPVPYYQRGDAYAASGFGSFADLEDSIVVESGSGRR